MYDRPSQIWTPIKNRVWRTSYQRVVQGFKWVIVVTNNISENHVYVESPLCSVLHMQKL